MIRPDFILDGNNRSLLNAATIALDATPNDIWKRSNFPEKSTQKKNMMKKVNTKGATAERFLVVLRELVSIYQRFSMLKSPRANPRDPVDSAVRILNRSGKEGLFPVFPGLGSASALETGSMVDDMIAFRFISFHFFDMKGKNTALIIFYKLLKFLFGILELVALQIAY